MPSPLILPFKKQHTQQIRDQQSRHHHHPYDASGQFGTKNPHRQIGSQKNKRKGEGTPGGMQAKQIDRQLNQIITRRYDGDMKQRQAYKRRLIVRR